MAFTEEDKTWLGTELDTKLKPIEKDLKEHVKRTNKLEIYVESIDNFSLASKAQEVAKTSQMFMGYSSLVLTVILGVCLWYGGFIFDFFKDIWMVLKP